MQKTNIKKESTAKNALQRGQAQFDASSRQRKKGRKSSRDKNEGTHRSSGEGGEKALVSDPGSELRLGRKKKEKEVRR